MATLTDLSQGVDNYNATQPAARATLNAGQNATTQDFLNRYKSAIGGQETSSAMATRIGNELGLPALQTNANNINTQVANLPSTYGSATRGFDVNANQLARTIGQKTYELTPAMTTANNAATNAQNIVNTRVGYGQADEQKQLLPYQSEQSLLSDRLARESTGFNTDSQNELNSLIQKMQTGATLSEGDANRANQLAAMKLQYDSQLGNFKSEAGYIQQNDPLGLTNIHM